MRAAIESFRRGRRRLAGLATLLVLAACRPSGKEVVADPGGRYYVVLDHASPGPLPLPPRTRYALVDAGANGRPLGDDEREAVRRSGAPRAGDRVLSGGTLPGLLGSVACVSPRGVGFFASSHTGECCDMPPNEAVIVDASGDARRLPWSARVSAGDGFTAGRCWYDDARGEVLAADDNGGLAAIDLATAKSRPGDAGDVRFLLALRDPEDRAFAADVAGGGKSAEVKPELLADLNRPDLPRLTRLHVAVALHWLGDDRGASLFFEALDDVERDPGAGCDRECEYAVITLPLLAGDRALPRLIRLVGKRPEAYIAWDVVQTFGDAAIPPLLELIRRGEAGRTRALALKSLAGLRTAASAAALLPLLDDRGESLRRAAVRAAVETPEPRFAPAILRARKDGVCEDAAFARYFVLVRAPEALGELRAIRARLPASDVAAVPGGDLVVDLDRAIELQERPAEKTP